MGLFRIFGGEAKDRLETYQAKQALEKKLGRKVEDHELFSLSSNMDASEADPAEAANPPLAHRESVTPFADAKPPVSMALKLVCAAVILLFVVVGGAGFFIWNMPEATYNRLNPFTPKPPPGVFPATIAGYQLEGEPVYGRGLGNSNYTFRGTYVKGTSNITLSLYNYKTPEAAIKDVLVPNQFLGNNPRIAEKGDSRLFVIEEKTGAGMVQFASGNQVVNFGNRDPGEVLAFENDLPFAAYGMEKPKPNDPGQFKINAIEALTVLDEYFKDEKATESKYNGKSFLFTGVIAGVTKSAKGIPAIAIQKPGRVPGLDSTVSCAFAIEDAAKVALLKTGATVKFRGTVNTKLPIKTIMIEDCRVVE